VLYLIWVRRRIFAVPNQPGANSVSPGSPAGGRNCRSMISRRQLSLFLMVVSILVIAFWCFRQTNIRGVRRVFSVANQYDFSWRNRVDSYVGSLQIMADHPWRGVGWSEPEFVYADYYMKDRITEGLAIRLNDYFNLGMSLGLPTLFCFVGYILIALHKGRTGAPAGDSASKRFACDGLLESSGAMSFFTGTTARAGVIVLLTGFWFDSGLLGWPFGLPFWFLLELSSQDFFHSANPDNSQTLLENTSGTLLPAQQQSRRELVESFRFSLWVLLLIALVAGCAMVWAKQQDPFHRVRFRADAPGAKAGEGIIISPKIQSRYPLAVYLYGAGGGLLQSGRQLRLIAKSGFNAASFSYSPEGNQLAFDGQFTSVCHNLQNWSGNQTNVVWVAYGLGACKALKFAMSNPELHPSLLICVGGAWTVETYETLANLSSLQAGGVPENTQSNRTSRPSAPIPCPVLLVQGREKSANLQVADEKLAALLRAAGTSVRLCVLPESGFDLEGDSLRILQMVMQYSAAQFPPA
jgi:hypothetical protein